MGEVAREERFVGDYGRRRERESREEFVRFCQLSKKSVQCWLLLLFILFFYFIFLFYYFLKEDPMSKIYLTCQPLLLPIIKEIFLLKILNKGFDLNKF